MTRNWIAAATCLVGALAWSAGRPDEIPFTKHALDAGANETAAVADVNGDGQPDIISGENWYQGPGWTKHKFRTLSFSNNYIDDFSVLPLDVNADGAMDLVSCTWFSRRLYWSENPGRRGGAWKEHDIETGHPIEFAFLVDLDNDGKAREVLPQFGSKESPTAWYGLAGGKFAKRVVSTANYGHGIGAGDVNGDRRNDVLTPKGWFEAPADLRAGDWKFHPAFDLDSTGFMHVLDVDGDGRNDVITSFAHNYGIFWMKQDSAGGFGKPIMIDDSWSQAHALTLVDLNGDGRMELVTGKRFMAHNGKDPGEREPLGVYWYEYRKSDDGKRVEWTKHVLDYSTRTGGGMQIPVADVDGDGDLDIVAPGKSGLFLFENLTKRK
ncbi:MAG TPA: VCBS repeat-containing protein [Bryobacteraceae bacterium]|nr:VCBS repeat-containing protein [Bryobacteraceae bacterium]